MIRPTIEKIDEIIDRLKELQATIANIEDKPPEFSKHKEADKTFLLTKKLLRLAAGLVPLMSEAEREKALQGGFQHEIPLFSNIYEYVSHVSAELPGLSQSQLKKLLKDDIPHLLADESVSKIKEQVWPGESPFTKGAQNLHFIRTVIDKQIKKNIEAAKERGRNKHIQPLRDEIDILLSPYDDFLQKYITLDVKDLSSGNTSSLSKVIHEFEKIRYRVKTETEQKTAPAKRRGIRARLKGLAKELYGLTIERVTKAYLDKYG